MHPRVVLNSLFRTWELVRQATCSILELVISELQFLAIAKFFVA